MEHRPESPKTKHRESSPAHRKSSLNNERETVPCIPSALNFPAQARQNPPEKYTDHQDGCSVDYRRKETKDVNLSLNNTSMSHCQSTA